MVYGAGAMSRLLALLVSLSLCTSASAQMINAPPGVPASGSAGGVIGTDSPTYFVDGTLGNDSNTCLASGTSACLTIQAAFNKATARSHAAATVQIADGTYTAGLQCNYQPQILSFQGVVITGNAAAPGNVVIDTSASNTNAVVAQNGCILTVQHLTTTANGAAAGSDFYVFSSAIVYVNDVVFGAAKSMHMDVFEHGLMVFTGNTAISGGGVAHYHVHSAGAVFDQGHVVSISNSPTFVSFFAGVAGPGYLAVIGTTYTNAGTVTAPTSLLVHQAGFVDTQAACASFFPGTAAVNSATSIDASTFGVCGSSSPLNVTFNSGLNATEAAPSAGQNYYLHGTGGGQVNLGSTLMKANLFDASGAPTITSGNCGTGTNGTVAGDNNAGTITIGASATTTCQVNFSTTLANVPHTVMLTARNVAAAGQITGEFVSAISATSFTITGTALANTVWAFQVR